MKKVASQTAGERDLSTPSLIYLGWIPYDKHISLAVRKQTTVLMMNPNTPASKSFMVLAQKLLKEEAETVFDGDIKFFWRNLLPNSTIT